MSRSSLNRKLLNPRGVNHGGGVGRWAQNVSTILLQEMDYSEISCLGLKSQNHNLTRLSETLLLPLVIREADFIVSLCNFGPVIENQILVIHDISPLIFPNYFSQKYVQFTRAMFPKLVKKSRGISTVSQFSRDQICEYFNISAEKVSISGASSGLTNLKANSLKSDPRQMKSRYMIFVGAHDERKNLKFLLNIWPTIYDKLGMELLVTGLSRTRIFKGKLDMHVQGVRYIESPLDLELAELIKNASALLSPSIYEGFGMPIIEALSLGTNVISSRTGIASEIICKGLKILELDSLTWEQAILSHTPTNFDFFWDNWSDVAKRLNLQVEKLR